MIQGLRERGIHHYNLLGHSMGGMIAQEIARRHGNAVNKLVLYSTGAVGVIPGRFETIAQSKARAGTDGALATARRISATWFEDEEQGAGYPDCSVIAEQAQLPAILAGLDAMEGWSGRDGLADLDNDTLILWGDGDRTYSWDQIHILWSHIPKARLAVIPACAHAVHMENPSTFCQILVDFLTA
ncbi:hypothetical protein GCM10007385_32390 [Tateyamaria omphalii]|nr:hypothetical protein GCM10007385_32390 [Tateyamaria omphalii]